MSIFVLKIIAIISMIIDHIRYITPEFDNNITKVIGRISFVLFAYILTEGIWHTKDRQKYLKRMVCFAVVSQIPFMLFRTIVGRFVLLDIMFTFTFAMIPIILIDNCDNKILKVLIGIIFVLLSMIVPIDYGAYGVILILVMYYFRKTIFFDIGFLSVTYIYYLIVYLKVNQLKMLIPYIIGNVIAYILIKFYNGKLGKKVKFLYWFYPIHMLVIYFIYLFVNNINIISL